MTISFLSTGISFFHVSFTFFSFLKLSSKCTLPNSVRTFGTNFSLRTTKFRSSGSLKVILSPLRRLAMNHFGMPESNGSTLIGEFKSFLTNCSIFIFKKLVQFLFSEKLKYIFVEFLKSCF